MIDKIELDAFINLFNRNGYVLDFSTAKFDSFTLQSVGVPLCEKYNMSKGKSLITFCSETDEHTLIKLLNDLLKYYELNCLNTRSEEQYKTQYNNCRKIMDRELNTTVKPIVPAIDGIDRTYIKNMVDRANRDIDNGDFDSAITKARTLLEEVFCYVIESNNETPSDKGNISNLYRQVKSLYSMHQSAEIDVRINTLLSGLEKILTAITEMRNAVSDSHGVGNRRIDIEDYHTRLFVNSSMTMAEFILSVKEKGSFTSSPT